MYAVSILDAAYLMYDHSAAYSQQNDQTRTGGADFEILYLRVRVPGRSVAT